MFKPKNQIIFAFILIGLGILIIAFRINDFNSYQSSKTIQYPIKTYATDEINNISIDQEKIDLSIIAHNQDLFSIETICHEDYIINESLSDKTLQIRTQASDDKVFKFNVSFFEDNKCSMIIKVPETKNLDKVVINNSESQIILDNLIINNLEVSNNIGNTTIINASITTTVLDVDMGELDINKSKMQSLQVNNNMGKLSILDTNANNLIITQDMGDITINALISTNINITTDLGDLELKNITTNQLVVNQEDGNINLKEIKSLNNEEQLLDVNSNNGSISLVNVYLNNFIIKSSNGDIDYFNDDLNFNFISKEIKTSNGDVNVNFNR
ncbi:MAG: DUF4097 family beta strand repeat-containing protein [Bacilli bacterium]